MLFQTNNQVSVSLKDRFGVIVPTFAPDRICLLGVENKTEVLEFLNIRPVHTVVMASFIHDNGFESELNRGKFYGYRDASGRLEGVALIGHSTLIEAHSDEAMAAFAAKARSARTPIKLVMAERDDARIFWSYYAGAALPRLTCTELLFESHFPMLVQECDREIVTVKVDDIDQIAAAHAEVAFIESGIDPLATDRDGFLSRMKRRIEMGRVFAAYDNGKLVFKADIVAEADGIAYIEGVWVSPEYRGQGIGHRCMSRLTLMLLERFDKVCLLSNEEFGQARRCFEKAGLRVVGRCTTLFV